MMSSTRWLDGLASQAVVDFWQIYRANLEANRQSAAALEHRAGGLGESAEQRVRDTAVRLEAAMRGDWTSFEAHLRELGEKYAQSGLDYASWYQINHTFYEAIVPHFVSELSADPARLTNALLALGAFMRTSLATIASSYTETRRKLAATVQQRHARILEASLDPVISLDAKGSILEQNLAAQRRFKFDESAYGRSFVELVGVGAERARLAKELRLAAAHGQVARFETLLSDTAGASFPAEVSLASYPTPNGVRELTAFIRDLSELKLAEATQALWSHVIEQAQFGLAITRPETREVVHVNRAYAHMLGYEPDELVGVQAERLVATESRAKAGSARDVVQQHGSHTYEVTLRRKDGTSIPVFATSSTVITEQGSVLRVSSVSDFSQQRALEEENARNTARVSIVSDAARRFSVASNDLRGLEQLVIARMTYALSAEVRFEHADAELLPSLRQLVIRLRTTREPMRILVCVREPDQQPFFAYDQALAEDLADRAALAIEHATLVEALEARVQDRTFELRQANEELEAFAAAVSHDLRAPLRAVTSHSRALVEDFPAALEPAARELLNRIGVNANKMTALIDDLLGFARLGRTPLHRRHVDVSTMATEILDELKRRDPNRRVQLHIEDRLETNADPKLLAVVLENLLSNAWKFTARASEEHIWLEQLETERGTEFVIRDSGAGFDMAYASRLFTPFSRLHAADQFEGVGIGLATVHRIVSRHGGAIRAEGEPGKGARFWFSFGA